jgi:hypothetical protein
LSVPYPHHRTVLKKAHELLGPILAKKTLQEILDLVNEIYLKFCSGASRQTEISQKSISHNNMLLRIRDFATIIEAKNAMKAGDPGRLMYMWKRWTVMGQGMPKLPHYSKHLPRLILMLEEGLPPSMDKVVMSTMLISPTGKADQFSATTYVLEIQNYWLKHFFNSLGIGTNIERLKDVFSLNIPTVSCHHIRLLLVPSAHTHLMWYSSCDSYCSCYSGNRDQI